MNPLTVIAHCRPVGRRRGPYRHLAMAAILALIVGAIGLAIETPIKIAGAVPFNETAVAAPLPTYPARELPKEWRGYREPVQFDHMYRKDPTPQLDWIR